MDGPERRLAAVWFADLVGYTELSSRDESAALALVDVLQRVTREAVERHRGRVVKFIGDAVLTEFTSTEAAVNAALELRDAFRERSAEEGPEASLRIGVHVGEVVRAPDGDLYGDGVNTASRLQTEAGAGDVVVSHDVWRQLRPRREFAFEALGMRELEGLPNPIAVFRALRPDESSGEATGAEAEGRGRLRVVGRFLASVSAYAVLALGVLQAAAVARARLELPVWVTPVAAVLLVVGLFVVSATAWARSRERAAAPAWEVDFQDLMDSLVERRVPTLTWGRAAVGGIAAFTFLFAVAGGVAYWQGGGRFGLSPGEARGDTGPRIAVLPFEARGEGAELYEEAMVDFLSLDLGGVPGLRTSDPLAVLGRWRESGAPRDTARLFELARSGGARYALAGSVVRSQDSLHLEIALHDLEQGDRAIRDVRIAGPTDSLPALLDRVRETIVEAGLPSGDRPGRSADLKTPGTASLPALLAYARGQRHLRRSDWDRAAEEFAAAVEADSTFALASYRLSLARRWSGDALPHSSFADVDAERAAELAWELPDRESLLIRGYWLLTRNRTEAIDTLSLLVELEPDLAEGWFHLGDAYYHMGATVDAPPERFREAFRRAVEADPTFAPAYLHLLDDARARRDTARGRRLLEEFRRADPGNPILAGYELANAFGSPAEEADAGNEPAGTGPPSDYEDLRTAVDRARRSAREEGATSSMLVAGDSARAAAVGSAGAGDYAAAMRELEMARTAYEDAGSSARWTARLDSGRAVVARLREAEDPDPEAAAEAERLLERASRAETDERFGAALAHLDEVADLYRSAADEVTDPGTDPAPEGAAGDADADPAGETDAPETPAAAPEAVVEATLERLRTALTERDADALARVWVTLDAEALANWRNFFSAVRDLSVSYEIRSLERTQSGLRARVARTREYRDARGDAVRDVGEDEIELERRGEEWVVVSVEELR